MDNYPMGIYEVTRLNPVNGRFEMDNFLFSDELHEFIYWSKGKSRKNLV